MFDQCEIECPLWVKDEAAISSLLELLLDKIDRGVKPLVAINKKSVAELFNFNSNNNHYIWSLIEALENEYCMVDITLAPPTAGSEVYEKAKVRLNRDKEDRLRIWLNRPKTPSEKALWIDAVHKHKWTNEELKQAVLSNPIFYPDKSSEEVISALLSTKLSMAPSITLRALSAKCFWGDSKFLDKRMDYLTEIFPVESTRIQPRKLLLNVYIPDQFSSVVLVENQDTFLLLANYVADTTLADDSNLNRTAFVYCAGFRGAASRVRDEGNTAFSFLSATNRHAHDRFTNWWVNNELFDIQTFFWGDLDYSGLGILAALQSIFPGIRAWETGYAAMVDYHHKGVYHPKQSAKKENQLAPVSCGCEYADTVLLPLISRDEYFLDQEVVAIDDLEGS